MNIDNRLDNMRERLERSKPCRMTITLKSGKAIKIDPVGAIAKMKALDWDNVSDVTANKPECGKLAELLTALCRWANG